MSLTDSQREYIEGLHAMADLMEQHPEAIPVLPFQAMHFPADKAEMLRLTRAIGGSWDKAEGTASYFELNKAIGPHYVRILTGRNEVCERVETGTETVEITDPDAPKVTVTRPTYEWKCPESLLEVQS